MIIVFRLRHHFDPTGSIIQSGKIEVIKAVRVLMGWGLKQAKDFVDQHGGREFKLLSPASYEGFLGLAAAERGALRTIEDASHAFVIVQRSVDDSLAFALLPSVHPQTRAEIDQDDEPQPPVQESLQVLLEKALVRAAEERNLTITRYIVDALEALIR